MDGEKGSQRRRWLRYDFLSPPEWPAPPAGWRPPPGWKPEPSWPSPDPTHQLWKAKAWWAQPLVWGLVYLLLSVIAQTISAAYWVSQGDGWFGSTAGKQLPVLVVLLAVLALVGFSPRRE